MSYASVLSAIQSNIVTNNNNDITAVVLEPILEAILDFANDSMGDLSTLDTTDKTSLVNAINEIFASLGNGITIHTGTADPNVTPPASYDLGDFYNRTSGGSTVGFYIYNNNDWVLLVDLSSQASYKTIKQISADYVVLDSDYTIMLYGASDHRTVTMPNPASYGNRELVLSNTTASFNMLLSVNVFDFDLSVLTQVDPETSIRVQAYNGAYYRIA